MPADTLKLRRSLKALTSMLQDPMACNWILEPEKKVFQEAIKTLETILFPQK